MVKVKNDLTGLQYGELTVVEQVEDYINSKGKHFARWRCKCSCGNYTDVSISNLTGGGVLSCGKCKHDKVNVIDSLVGQIFGKLTVLSQAEDYVSPQGKHQAQWLCECSCDEHNQVIVGSAELKKGDTQSCGCYKRENAQKLYKKYNQWSEKLVDEHGEYYVGLTTNTNKEFYIDADDYDKVKEYCWLESVATGSYNRLVASVPCSNKQIKLTNLIGKKRYDHIDRNPLNNRKYNLRPCTNQENARNRGIQSNNKSGFTGVFWNKTKQTWRAYVTINRKHIILGEFINKKDAIVARLKAEKEYYGEFAPQKHLFEQYGINTQQNDLNKETDNK